MVEHCITAEIGRFYMVPCIHVGKRHLQTWIPRDGWVPTIGPKHTDAEHLKFTYEHYHVDWRFLSPRQFEDACGIMSFPHGRVITSSDDFYVVGRTVPKRRKCQRAMPDFPSQAHETRRGYTGSPSTYAPGRWASLEQAHRCERLKPGNICPHRGIDLTPFIKPDGTVICPGHGLRWDTRTGELLPHHMEIQHA